MAEDSTRGDARGGGGGSTIGAGEWRGGSRRRAAHHRRRRCQLGKTVLQILKLQLSFRSCKCLLFVVQSGNSRLRKSYGKYVVLATVLYSGCPASTRTHSGKCFHHYKEPNNIETFSKITSLARYPPFSIFYINISIFQFFSTGLYETSYFITVQ